VKAGQVIARVDPGGRFGRCAGQAG
jgi:hypothetical protein